MIKQCLLAPNRQVKPESLKYPVLTSPKMDGIRCIAYKGFLLSRNLKPIPNNNLSTKLAHVLELSKQYVLDGELYNHDLSFSEISSIVMSRNHPVENIDYHIFDCLTITEWETEITAPYMERYKRLVINNIPNFLHHNYVDTPDRLNLFYNRHLEEGYEGLIARNCNAQYKWRRATVNESIIYKFKPIDTLDGIVIEEIPAKEMKDIERTRHVTGALERPYTKDSYTISNRIGSLLVRINEDQEFGGKEVKVGFGKGWSWDKRKNLLGKKVEFSYMKYGSKDVPRMGKLERVRECL